MRTAKFYYRDPTAPAPNRPYSLGVVALIERDDALLLERRRDGGGWGLIGGAAEQHESLDEALRREVLEETGLTVDDYALFGTFSDPSRIIHYPSGDIVRIITLVYRVTIARFDALRYSDESTALRFFRRDELQRLAIVETHRHIVDQYLSPRQPRGIVLA